MPLLVDTYNVLHTVGVLPPEMAGIELNGLADLIELSRYGRRKICLVCDGTPAPGALNQVSPHIKVRYAGRGRTADDEIAWLVATSTHPRRLIVVSTDAAVARGARKRRARVLRSDTFLEQLVTDFEHQSRATKAKIQRNGKASASAEAWLNEFNLSDHELAIPSSTPTASWRTIKPEGESQRAISDTDPTSDPPRPSKNAGKTDRQQPDSDDTGDVHGLPDRIIAEAERIEENGDRSN